MSTEHSETNKRPAEDDADDMRATKKARVDEITTFPTAEELRRKFVDLDARNKQEEEQKIVAWVPKGLDYVMGKVETLSRCGGVLSDPKTGKFEIFVDVSAITEPGMDLEKASEALKSRLVTLGYEIIMHGSRTDYFTLAF